ncbi:TPA: 23S rRNA methyltransferase attenuation leader peptide [Streptococcus pyogenes]|nr:23S rRNA methyltransferase attenuation leader peptide [Streptococcus pyogenes]HER8920860.1 23S rRNA methyltransferase attenuation leader peptide [Streptococcus pyogenes]
MLVFQMRNVDKTSTVLKQTKNSDYIYKQIV